MTTTEPVRLLDHEPLYRQYIATIFDVGEQVMAADDIADAARKFVIVWGNEAVLDVRRVDYRALS